MKSVEGMMMMMEWVTDLSIHNHNTTTTIEAMMLWIEDKAFTITTALSTHHQQQPIFRRLHCCATINEKETIRPWTGAGCWWWW